MNIPTKDMHIRYLAILFLCVWMFVPVHAELIPDSTWTFHQPEAHDHAEENEIWLSADRPGAGTGSEVLGKGFPHLRVDFYEVNGQVFFGELTLSHWSGLVPFVPGEWDTTIGNWLKLPK